MAIGKGWNLHRVGKKADWELIAKEKQNKWQRVASATKGVVTPANVTSVAGAVLVGFGLWYLYLDNLLLGLILIVVGRLADILDGMIAQTTGTKSSVGEAVDVTIDKVIFAAALIVFIATGTIPMFAAVLMVARNGIIITLGLLARAHKRALHVSRTGKFASALEWASIFIFIMAAVFAHEGWAGAETASLIVGYVTLGITLLLSIVAIKDYGEQTFSVRRGG